ncbi:MAG: YqaA family protein [Verrucomicrobiales bacterium]
MLQALQQSLQKRANSSQSHLFFMGVASFLEATVVPIPLETLLIPYFHKHRDSLWRTAAVVTLACLIGASVFYLIGKVALDSWGQSIIETFSDVASFDRMKDTLNEHGFLLILLAGISPVPFQIAMLGAGAVDYPFANFLLAATIARGIRYFGLAYLVHRYGHRALKLWQVNKLKASAAAVALTLAIYGIGRLLQASLMG